jgi:copper homeostasis protein (lipoprotein)
MRFSKRIATIAILAATSIVSSGMLPASAGAQDAPQQKASASPHGKLLATYHGVLPCADCPGIDTTVKLFAAGAHDTQGLYVIHHAYQDRKSSYNETGTWTLEKGTPGDASATLYVLKPKTGNGVTNFLRVGDNEIKQLDNDRKPFAGNVNFSLKRVAVTAPPPDAGKPAI